jgi:hypothetical protein
VVLNNIITVISFRSTNTATGSYASFSRNSAVLSAAGSYTVSGFTLVDGLELLFLNGTVVTSQDYNITGQDITFIAETTGDLQIIQWSLNNLSVANGTPVNVDTYTIIGQSIYPFNFNPNAFNLWNNGVMQLSGTDYTTATNTYTLTTVPTSISNILTQQTFTRTGAV